MHQNEVITRLTVGMITEAVIQDLQKTIAL